ncbi:MAG: GAF domain-containing protein, partial [Fulvivirga sp.]
STPSAILISPIFDEHSMVGAVELASFRNFTKIEIEFIRSISRVIAISITNIKRTSQLEKLNIQSQLAQASLKEKEEEIKQQLEELQANNEELDRKSQELEHYKLELEQRNNEIVNIRLQEKQLLESQLQSQQQSYELIINKLKDKLIKLSTKTN